MSARVVALCGFLAALVAGCERESRPFTDLPAASGQTPAEAQTPLAAGQASPPSGVENPFRGNAWAIGEGKRLFTWYNCSGCHANGGGAIGPALMDDEWIYGFQPENVYSTILEGRPNGMPAFRNRIPDYQVWQLVAYVHSMSGHAPVDALPGRSDHMRSRTPEVVSPAQEPRQTGHK
jgi:cytochrome c oxidase cbb3-type subunit 3